MLHNLFFFFFITSGFPPTPTSPTAVSPAQPASAPSLRGPAPAHFPPVLADLTIPMPPTESTPRSGRQSPPLSSGDWRDCLSPQSPRLRHEHNCLGERGMIENQNPQATPLENVEPRNCSPAGRSARDG